jgi:hypothetical protein
VVIANDARMVEASDIIDALRNKCLAQVEELAMDIPKLPSHMGEVRPLSAFTAATACVVTVPRRVLCAAARHAVSRGRAAAEGRRGCVCLLPGQQVCRRARWRSCCRRGSTVGKVRCMSSCFPRVPIGVSVSGFVFAVVVVVVCVWVGISVY